ncbi:hypothetical protein FN846DRAFT_910525 [Sphaerosporella brunnea]|uniref:Uncharacterized protein n=1 Tax=Sphaerosporella brunnea TaxID=1250544 RepID=A0A5J5EMV2_9PEZI|nr:hypothetical protein FN846DRAFT_910525 [Sphaerosporella brunnea]
MSALLYVGEIKDPAYTLNRVGNKPKLQQCLTPQSNKQILAATFTTLRRCAVFNAAYPGLASLHNRSNHVNRAPSSPTVLRQLLMVVLLLGHRGPLHFGVYSNTRLRYLAQAVTEKLGVAVESIGSNDADGHALVMGARIETLDLWFNDGYGH